MFRKLVKSISLELVLMRRSFFIGIFMLVSLGMLFSIMGQRLSHGDVGGALTATAAIVQIGIFAFMVFGFMLSVREQKVSADEMFQTIHEAPGIKLLSKSCALFLLALLFVAVAWIGESAWLIKQKIDLIFAWKSLLYLLLYYLLPFFISGLIGLLLGALIKSRLVYILLVGIGILIGPLNMLILENVMVVFNFDLTRVLTVLNLGQSDIAAAFDPLYGYPLELSRWMVKLTWVFVSLSLLIVLVSWNNHRRFTRQTIVYASVSIGLACMTSIVSSFPDQVLVTVRTTENSYLKEEQQVVPVTEQVLASKPDFEITSYEADIDTFRQLKVSATAQVKLKAPLDRLTFTLYRNLKISSIQDDSNHKLDFRQEGDHVKVQLSETYPAGTAQTLKFIYSGISSPYFYANEQAVLLPGYFPWLPVEGEYSISVRRENGFLRHTPLPTRPAIPYTLHYSGPGHTYSNLSQKNGDTFKGISSEGITLVSGMIGEAESANQNLVYPLALARGVEEGSDAFVARFDQMLNRMAEDLDLETTAKSEAETVLFLPIPVESNKYWETVWKLDHQWIVSVHSGYEGKWIFEEQAASPSAVMLALLRSQDSMKQEDFLDGFCTTYSYWYTSRYAKQPENTLQFLISDYRSSNSADEADTLEKIKGFIDRSSEEEVKRFFVRWLTLLESGAGSYSDLETML